MRKGIFITTALSLLLISCASQKENVANPQPGSFLLESQFKDFIPVSPLEFEQTVVIFNDVTHDFDTLTVKELVADKKLILKFLPNETVFATVRKNDSEAEAKFGVAAVTAERGSYTVTLDYAKFTTLKILQSGGGCAGYTKVGVGLRITAQIVTMAANVDVSSLFGLGLAAKTNQLRGQLSVDVIGMESSKITDLITLPVDISEASIQTALQSMSAIKSKIYDPETNLFPQIVAIKRSPSQNCSVFEILNSIELPTISSYDRGKTDGQLMGALMRSIDKFRAANNRFPNSIEELKEDNLIKMIGLKKLDYKTTPEGGFTLLFAGGDGTLYTPDDKKYQR
ncbi:hypothetical protein HNQ91_000690 [Filimonas zeae]|uniref:Lipoprotein n=1 Tax=Filimonas zeae TaxID=1737353 RepID=A0A917INN0_9BACT|nr:hypothetical protein [Filimonas zeae]MDR6337668.1 hypothetical protein [Filimonas zeae]GGH59711.1 hypothetical protein GCM10011379_06780 [Filimonas zeae]